MYSFNEIKAKATSREIEDELKLSLIQYIENCEYGPFKNIENSMKIISCEEGAAFSMSYEIFHENRSHDYGYLPTTESIHTHIPVTNKSNINTWAYKIDPKELFLDHEEFHSVADSIFVTTCDQCSGHGRYPCDHCQGNGKCRRCSGRGEYNCTCGNGFCSDCAGRGENRTAKGFKKCYTCGGSGKHSVCGGSGEIRCTSCYSSGVCGICKSQGIVECTKCEGCARLENFLVVKSTFTNSKEPFQLINETIESTNPINLHLYDAELQPVLSKCETKFDVAELGSFTDIIDLNRFLIKRKEDFTEENILQERITLVKVPIFIVTYQLNEKLYTSYFVGNSRTHFFKNNPILDYNQDLDKKIEILIKGGYMSSAITLLIEQEHRYKYLKDDFNLSRCTNQIVELKRIIQKQITKGGFYAQITFALFDLFFMSVLFSMNSHHKENYYFFIVYLMFLLTRAVIYIHYVVLPSLLANSSQPATDSIEKGQKKNRYLNIGIKTYIIPFFILIVIFSNSRPHFEEPTPLTFNFFIIFSLCALIGNITFEKRIRNNISERILKIKNNRLCTLMAYSLDILIFSFIGLIMFYGQIVSSDTLDFNTLYPTFHVLFALAAVGVIGYLISQSIRKIYWLILGVIFVVCVWLFRGTLTPNLTHSNYDQKDYFLGEWNVGDVEGNTVTPDNKNMIMSMRMRFTQDSVYTKSMQQGYSGKVYSVHDNSLIVESDTFKIKILDANNFVFYSNKSEEESLNLTFTKIK